MHRNLLVSGILPAAARLCNALPDLGNRAENSAAAFQTNDFGGDGTGAGTKDSSLTLTNSVALDGNIFIAILEDGLSVPNQSGAPPYTELYPYAPYIEIHYQDVLKWNGGTSYYYGASVVGNAILTAYEDIFGP